MISGYKIEKKQIVELLDDNIDNKYYYTDKSSTWNLVQQSVTKPNTVYQYRRVYVRENKSNECPTFPETRGGLCATHFDLPLRVSQKF